MNKVLGLADKINKRLKMAVSEEESEKAMLEEIQKQQEEHIQSEESAPLFTSLMSIMNTTKAIKEQVELREDVNDPDIVELTVDGHQAGYWMYERALRDGVYRPVSEMAQISISKSQLKESKLNQLAGKFEKLAQSRETMLPPPMEEEPDIERDPVQMDTIPAPPPEMEPMGETEIPPPTPTLPSQAEPAFLGEVDREVLIGNYQLVLEKDPNRVRQAHAVYVRDPEGEVVADWLDLGGSAADFAWNIASELLGAIQS